MKRTRQTTLDQTPYVERNRLGEMVVRKPKANAADYTLCVLGSSQLKESAWILAQLEDVVKKEKRGRYPHEVLLNGIGKVSRVVSVWAYQHDIPMRTISVEPGYLQKWPKKEHGNLAYQRRDEDLIEQADCLVALWLKPTRTLPAIVARAADLNKLLRYETFEKAEEEEIKC
jgi:hypothetical protein